MTDKLLILDIDETLIHSDVLEPDFYDFMVLNKYYTIKRPYIDDFLKYAFDNFTVGIFTSSTEDYAIEILNNLNVELDKLLFLWDREKCTSKFNYDMYTYNCVKKIDKVRKSFNWNINKMIIVDNDINSAIYNYGNLICVKDFLYDLKDVELNKLINYLEKIKNAENIRNIEKRGWSNNL